MLLNHHDVSLFSSDLHFNELLPDAWYSSLRSILTNAIVSA
jgi:hypothetical protein